MAKGYKKCPACQTEVGNKTKVCPECGNQFYPLDLSKSLDKGFSSVKGAIKTGFTEIGKSLKDGIKESNETTTEIIKEELSQIPKDATSQYIDAIEEVESKAPRHKNMLSRFKDYITKPFEEARKEQREIRDQLKRAAVQRQLQIKIAEKNIPLLEEQAKNGDENAEKILKMLDNKKTQLELDSITELLKSDKAISAKNASKFIDGVVETNELLHDNGTSFEINFSDLLNSAKVIIDNEQGSLEERRETIDKVTNQLNKLVKSSEFAKLSENNQKIIKDKLEEIKRVNVLQSNLQGQDKSILSQILSQLSDNTQEVKINQTMKDIGKNFGPLIISYKKFVEFLKKQSSKGISYEELLKKSGLQELSNVIKKGFAETILSQFGLAGMGIGEFITDIEKMKSTILVMWENLKKVGSGFLKVFKAFKWTINKVTFGLSDFVLKSLNKSLSIITTGITTAISAPFKKGGFLNKLYTKHFKELAKGFGKLWDKLKGSASGLGGMLMGVVTAAIGWLLGMGGGATGGSILKEVGKKGLKYLKPLAKLGIKSVGGAMSGGLLSSGMTGYEAYSDYQDAKDKGASPEELSKIKTKGISKTVGSGIGTGIGMFFGGPIGGFIGSMIGEYLGDGIGDWINDGGVSKILDAFKDGFNTIIDSVCYVWDETVNSVAKLFSGDTIIEKLGTFFTTLIKLITDEINIAGLAKDIFGSIFSSKSSDTKSHNTSRLVEGDVDTSRSTKLVDEEVKRSVSPQQHKPQTPKSKSPQLNVAQSQQKGSAKVGWIEDFSLASLNSTIFE